MNTAFRVILLSALIGVLLGVLLMDLLVWRPG
jgi:hypothetical protein